MLATIWEVWNDQFGDPNKKEDVWIRAFLFWIEAIIIHLVTDTNILVCLNLSISIFFLTFDYIINYMLIKNGVIEPPRGMKYYWLYYLGSSSVVDNLSFWRNMNPWARLVIRVLYFGISITLYFVI